MSSQELLVQTANHGSNVVALHSRAGLPEAANVGAVAIEQERAIAEAQGQLIMAKRFPRNLNEAHEELMVACSYPSFAAAAFYSVPNRGSGPSIRFAEEVARVYGNFEFGHRELSRSEGKSEVEVYAWDKEKNNLSKRQITVIHVTDTRNGPKKLTDQADIDNKIANVASKQVRGRILALLPKWLVEDAIQKCKDTIAGNTAKPMEVRLRDMAQAFLKFGVTSDHLERYLGHPIEATLADELAELIGVHNALKEGTPASDFFGAAEAEAKSDETAAALAQTAKAQPQAAAAATATTATQPRPRRQTAARPTPDSATATTTQETQPEQQQQQQQQQQPDATAVVAEVKDTTANVTAEQTNQVEPQASEQQSANPQETVETGTTGQDDPTPDGQLTPEPDDVF